MFKNSKFSTGSLARTCATHPWLTIGAWLMLCVLGVLSSSQYLGSALTTEMKFTRPLESEQGRQLLADRLRGPQKINEVVIVTSADYTVDDPAFRAQLDQLGLELIGLGRDVIEGGTYYYQSHDETLVSSDRHTTILPLVMAGTLAEADKNIDKVHDVTARAAERSGFQILTTGGASGNNDSNSLSESDLRQAELMGIPMAMLILLVVFGSFIVSFLRILRKTAISRISPVRSVVFVVAGSLITSMLPMLLAAFSIVIAIGITAIVGQYFQMSFFVVNMITMMGLAVGIDYSLFVASRYLEEMIHGRDKISAIEKAGQTASRAVFFSGMTVILALAGMLIVPMSLFYSLAAGAIFVVAVSVMAALTLLPAMLSLFGGIIRVLKSPLDASRQSESTPATGGLFWNWITREVMGHPVVSALVAITLLVVPATYYFQIHTGANGINALPDSYQSKQGFMILDREFSFGLVSPVEVVIDGDASSPEVKNAIVRLGEATRGDADYFGNQKIEVNPAGDLTLVSLSVKGYSESDQATGAVKRLRLQYIPEAFAGVDATVLVTGASAGNLDYFNMTDDYRPIVFAFVLTLSFLLLTIVFHSLVVPLKAIIMNMLSVGASYGLIVLVFQKGVGAGFFGFQQVAAVEAWVPLFLFSVLFGLSMDYHVFLLGRIREQYMLTGNNSESVATGLRTTGRIITGAALIMVVVFSGFASGQLVMFQQMGFGLAVAVLLDATVVRSILVPATMKMLGDWNWYLPKWLQWLPDFHVEGGGAEEKQHQ